MGKALYEMTFHRGGGLQLSAILIVLAAFLVPIALGLWETALPAFGIQKGIGYDRFNLSAWERLFGLPGVLTSIRLTLFTGFASTLLSLSLAVGFCAAAHGRVGLRQAERLLSPLLSAPHAAMAIGVAFLLAPSGWIARILSSLFTGWSVPASITTIHDPMGLSLVAGLVVKEVPFFLLVIIAALNQIPVREQLATGRSLGYGRGVVWVKIIFPQVYRQIRLPVFATLAFVLSVVDVAIILGPSNPPVLSVAAMRWFLSANIDLLLPAAAAAILQIAIVAFGILAWWIGEKLIAFIGRRAIRRGGRGLGSEPLIRLATFAVLVIFALGFLAIISLLVWSFAWRWTFPDVFPSAWTLTLWTRSAGSWGYALFNTITLGVISSLLSVLLAVLWLEGEDRSGRRVHPALMAAIYIPLLVPQIGFLYGMQVVFLRAGLDDSFIAVLWAHTLFVFPYIVLAASDPWRALDRRYIRTAAALGASPNRILLKVKLPILLRPVATAVAIGFSVSVAQYLATLFMGAGRIVTLTTEAVTLSSGGDRRIVGTYAVLQSILPLLVYVIAFYVSRRAFPNRRAMNGDAP